MNFRHLNAHQPLPKFTSSMMPSMFKGSPLAERPEMEPQTAPAAEKMIDGSECAERILEIVLGLQQQIADCEAESQLRSKHVIEETQRHIEAQLRAESEQAVLEAQAVARRTVTQKLLSRFDTEICRLEADFERRLCEAIRETEASAQVKLNENQQLVARLEEQRRTDAGEWRTERQRFLDRIAALERSLDTVTAFSSEELAHYKEVERKLEEALLLKAQLGLDLQRVVSELNAQTHVKAQHDSDRAAHGEVATIVHCEMARVQSLCDDIERKLADPTIDLATEIRLNREWSELQAYLKGLRYSLGEVTLPPSALEGACNA